MKKNVLILILLSLSTIINAADVNVIGTKISVTGLTAGGLDVALATVTEEQLTAATELKLQGVINSDDFDVLKNSIPDVPIIDMAEVTIAETDIYTAKTIPSQAFKSNLKLSSIILPNDLVNIGSIAFYGCKALKKIVFPSSLIFIEGNAFKSSGLISVTLNANITLGQGVFTGCKIDSVFLEKGSTSTTSITSTQLYNSGLSSTINSVLTSSANYVVKSGSFEVNSITIFKSLSIGAGAEVIIDPTNSSLTVTGDLVLHSDPTNGTATVYNKGIQSSLIVNGTTKVEQYLTSGKFWYITTPMNGCTLTSGGDAWIWSETVSNYLVGSSTASGQGFVLQPISNGNIAFTGNAGTTLNFSDVSKVLTHTSGFEFSGVSLIGNPYPSYLDWDQVYKYNNTIDPTITYSVGGDFATYNAIGGVSANGASNDIPPMQSLWVFAPATTTLNLKNSYCVSRTADPSSKLKADVVSDKQLVRLKIAQGDYADEEVLVFSDEARNDFDLWDSKKRFAENDLFPQIYTIVDSEIVIINAMKAVSSVDIIPVYFTTKQEGTFTFSASEIVGLDGYTVELKDVLLNKTTVLNNDNNYTFNSVVTADAKRFEVRLKANSAITGIDVPSTEKSTIIYGIGKDIVVKTNETINAKGIITVYNALGQIIAESKIEGAKTVLKGDFVNGTYFVKVQTENNVISESVEIF